MANIYGNASANTLTGTSLADLIDGGGGNDTIHGGSGNDRIYGRTGDDRLFGEAGNDVIAGGDGKDFLDGGSGDDRLYGDAGDDVIHGGIGNDYLVGGDGFDRLRGEDGNDRIDGGAGNDILDGGAGNDMAFDDRGANTVYLGDGDDTFMGDYEPQDYTGSSNVVYAGNGNDQVFGGDGNDNIRGGYGNDQLNGGFGVDRIDGEAGNDFVYGAGTLLGGAGDDTLVPIGDSMIFTGAGRDKVVLGFNEVDGSFDIPGAHRNELNVKVADFTPGVDKLSFSENDSTQPFDPDFPRANFRVSFADLDTNHNGILTDADQGITIGRMSINGETKFAMTIDLDFSHVNQQAFGHGSLTLFGVTTLTEGDIVSA